MTAPLIAVSTWRRALPTSLGDATDLYTLGGEYADAIEHAGGVPVLIPNLGAGARDPLPDRFDGVLLSGGQDVGGIAPEDAARDRTEAALLAASRARGIPVFGICRGLQLANVALGGSLQAELPVTADHPHADGAQQLEVRHAVTATAGWLAAALPADGLVNSVHHQAIDRLAEGLRAVATTSDGVIEAVEGVDPEWFFRAVQWHPEKMPGPSGRNHSDRLLAGFIAAAAEHARGGRRSDAAIDCSTRERRSTH